MYLSWHSKVLPHGGHACHWTGGAWVWEWSTSENLENYCDFPLVQLTSDFWLFISSLLCEAMFLWVAQLYSRRELYFPSNFYTSCRWYSLRGYSTLLPPYGKWSFHCGSEKPRPDPCCSLVFFIAILTRKFTTMTTSTIYRLHLQRATLTDLDNMASL